MKRIFFEDPFWIYVGLLLVEGVLLMVWRQRRERSDALRLLVPPGIAALVFAVATLVVTDREKILEATDAIVEDVRAGRLDALERTLDVEFRATFHGRALNRESALSEAREALSRHAVSDVEIKRVEVVVDGPKATQRMVTLIRLKSSDFRGNLPVLWRLTWIRTGGRWRIYEAAPPRVGAQL